jgi:hypothetical protein
MLCVLPYRAHFLGPNLVVGVPVGQTKTHKLSTHVNCVQILMSCCSIRALWTDIDCILLVLIVFLGIVTVCSDIITTLCPSPQFAISASTFPNSCFCTWRIADTNHSEYDASMMMTTTNGQIMPCTLKTTFRTLVQPAMTLYTSNRSSVSL